jgi:hypothetical protein
MKSIIKIAAAALLVATSASSFAAAVMIVNTSTYSPIISTVPIVVTPGAAGGLNPQPLPPRIVRLGSGMLF